MRSRFPRLVFPVVLGLAPLFGSGCAMEELKNTNRRLKEANDRLVSENNRLEQELAASEKEVTEKQKTIDDLRIQDRKDPAPAPTSYTATGDDPALRLPGGRGTPPGFDGNDGIEAQYTPRGILLRLEDRVFFSTGQATLSPKGKAILGRIANTLNTRYRGHLIRVEGHTDDVPVQKVKNKYPTNWELSTARACSVVRYLVDSARLSPTRVYPAGFASYKPVTSARTATARQKNRRVEILILNEKA